MESKTETVEIADGTLAIGPGRPLAFICGPCVIESRDHLLFMADALSELSRSLRIPLIFKSSYDKANRTSSGSFRGLGLDEGLALLSEVKKNHGLPVITDVHSEEQARAAAQAVDVIQIPAFLCRQTDLLLAAGATGKPVLVKKGQFVHPADMRFAADKIQSARPQKAAAAVMLCERGACFGYRELVVDFRALAIMRGLGCPVVFDATHSVQVMGGAGGKSSGNREFVPALARAAVAAGVDAVFLECHDRPDEAPSDGPNMIPLDRLRPLLEDLAALGSLKLNTRDQSIGAR